ncbi:MAG: DUF362 domain-containing protein [Labilithrix sp.]|nr:DUF362 domain-containing protein [Labilithrix sp.]
MREADKRIPSAEPRRFSRRRLLALGASLGLGTLALSLKGRIRGKLAAATQLPSFTATPALVPHDPARDRATIHVARGGSPADNVDQVLAKLGGIGRVVGADDVVIVKVSAQWWNQGMTNVAAVKRLVEHVLELPGFAGEVIVFENTHFRLADGSGLSRAWRRPSERNVDVPGWTGLGDLIGHFRDRGAPVSFVGLVDAGPSALADDAWHDPTHELGTYGGDGRGPIAPGETRDGYRWDFERAFRMPRSWVDEVRTPLTWPRFTSPRTGLVVDLADGVHRRDGDRLVPADRKLVWINMTTANEHAATGFTGACKSTMGVVDMSAGALGTHPLASGYTSVHYCGRGSPGATWRMAGPLAQLARDVRSPDLVLLVAEWVAFEPAGWDQERADLRHAEETCLRTRTIVAGTDPVAIDTWAVKNLMMQTPSANKRARFDLDDPDAQFTKFLRYYRQVRGSGTLAPHLIDIS